MHTDTTISITTAENRHMMGVIIPHRGMINSMIPFPVTLTAVNRSRPETMASFTSGKVTGSVAAGADAPRA